MALLILDTSHLSAMPEVFQINSDILKINDEVVITSLITKGNTRDLVARLGKITEVYSNGTLVNAPIYKTNIPIEPGASGGPVFKYHGNFEGAKEVIGVVSSDFSTPEAFSNSTIDGESTVLIICSASPLNSVNAEGREYTFQDMCREGLVKDIGSYMDKVELTFKSDGNWSQRFPNPY